MRAAVASTLAGMLGLLGPAAWAEPIEWRPAAPAAARESPPPAARESPPPAAPPEAAPTAWSAARGQSPDDGAAPRVVELTRAE
ncbi:MAG TPA: hypothetical protein VIL46_00325, partial [Gemmataceae bacterium]